MLNYDRRSHSSEEKEKKQKKRKQILYISVSKMLSYQNTSNTRMAPFQRRKDDMVGNGNIDRPSHLSFILARILCYRI